MFTHKLMLISGFVTEMLVVGGGPGAATVLAIATLARRAWRAAPAALAA